MYVSPVLSKNNAQTPKEYTNRARDEINRKLNLNIKSSAASQLRHGSSPLKFVASASDSLSKTNSSESLELQLPMALNHDNNNNNINNNNNNNNNSNNTQEQFIQQKEAKPKSKLFGLSKLRHLSNNSSSSSLSKSSPSSNSNSNRSSPLSSLRPSQQNLVQHDQDDDVEMDNYQTFQTMPELHPVPSISSSFSSAQSSISSAPSMASSRMTQSDSLFSTKSDQTQETNLTQLSTNHSMYTDYNDDSIIPEAQGEAYRVKLTLQDALPHSFQDMYAPELLADPSLLIDGRPMFTKRALLDWDLNDIRSLLIVDQLKEEWNHQLPIIISPQGFKFEYLPLDADDDTIIRVLVESDIYKEAKFDEQFRIQTAKYTLNAARSRHALFLQNSGIPIFYNNRLSKPEWRNVIENFLLNLAVEAQCRYDFKKSCHDYKKLKKNQANAANSNNTPSSSGNSGNSLLRKAILNDVQSSTKNNLNNNNSNIPIKLTKEDKARLWTQVQSKVYKRIGLDWTPDSL